MVMAKVLDGPEHPPSSFAPHVPRALDDIVMKGLAHEPKDRFPTARDMARALEKAVSFASTSDIGDWVEKVAGRGLAERAERVKAMESSSVTHSTPSGTIRRDSTPPRQAEGLAEATQLSSGSSSAPHDRPSRAAASRGRTPGLLMMLGVAGVTLLAAGAIVHFRSTHAAVETVPIEPEVVREATVPVADDRQPVPTATASGPSVAATPDTSDTVLELEYVDAGSAPAPTRRTPRPPGPRPPKIVKPKLNCNPPYVDDPTTGRRKWRPECLP
jgi:serine/threonine-protein kinase